MEPLSRAECLPRGTPKTGAGRLRAYELSQQGWTQKAIAQARGVTEGAVSQGMARARTGGGPQARTRRSSSSPGSGP